MLFELDTNGNPILTPEIRLVPEFKAILDKDMSPKKSDSIKFFAYIYMMCDYKSPYMNMVNEKERMKQIGKDFIKDENYKPTEKLITAMNKYRELQETPSMKLLYSTREAVAALEEMLRSIKTNPPSDVKEALDIAKLAERVGPLNNSLIQLEEQIKRELSLKSRFKGNKTITRRED